MKLLASLRLDPVPDKENPGQDQQDWPEKVEVDPSQPGYSQVLYQEDYSQENECSTDKLPCLGIGSMPATAHGTAQTLGLLRHLSSPLADCFAGLGDLAAFCWDDNP